MGKIKLKSIPYTNATVVLSGGLSSNINKKTPLIEWSDPDRFFAGIDIIKAKKSSTLVFTGGSNLISKQTLMRVKFINKSYFYGYP